MAPVSLQRTRTGTGVAAEDNATFIEATSGKDLEKGLTHQSAIIGSSTDEDEFSGNSSVRGTSIAEIHNPNLVQWEGVDDPTDPQNWKRSKKWIAISLVSAFTFMSPVSSSILAPSLPTIGQDLNIQSTSVQNLCLSIFVLGFAFGPLFLAPCSEMYGRSTVLQMSNLLYIIFNTACGFVKTKEQLIVFRLIAGLGGSAPLALGSGVIADLFSADERGMAISIYSLFPVLGPAIGPICGSFISQYSTWRWAFWAPSIISFPILLLGTFCLQETYPPVLLMRKKNKLMKETGNQNLFTSYEKPGQTITSEMKQALVRPFKLMATQVVIVVLGLYMAFLYGLMYIVLTTYPLLWTERYHESKGVAGLNFISLGIGYCCGIQIAAPCQDRLYRYLKKRNNGVGLPEFRAPLLIPVAILLPVGLFIYGWSAEYTVHWIVPSIGAALFAAGIMIGFNALITYILDSYPTYAASAIAASTLLRSLAGFLFPLFAPSMYAALGYGWGTSVLGFVSLAIGLPAPVLLWVYGARLRAKSTYATG